MAGTLQALPADLQKDPLLRIHQLRLARRDAEEGRVELVDLIDHPTGTHIGRVGGQLRRP